jgi:hypothetical protein
VTNSTYTPPPVEEARTSRQVEVENEQKCGHGSQWSVKPRMIVLARTSSNLLVGILPLPPISTTWLLLLIFSYQNFVWISHFLH